MKLQQEQFKSQRNKLQEEIDSKVSENRKLQDELHINSEKSKKLAVAEATIERYKTKIQELSNARVELQHAEEQHSSALERIVALELQLKQIPALQNTLNKAKEQIAFVF